ncbi:MAG: ParB/RepB/Spo0J family partition protein [Zavarzinella sp.]
MSEFHLAADHSDTRHENLALTTIHVNPNQPRKHFDDEEILQLMDSIKQHGILQPLLVRPQSEGYQLIAGERRYRAAQLAGLEAVPVTVVNFDDRQVFEAALVENIQRADLNPIEKGQGFKEYMDKYGASQDELATRLGVDRSTVSNLVNLLNLPAEIQNAVRLGQITLGHAKAIKGVATEQRQLELCREVIMKGLSVKALDMIIRQEKAAAEAQQAAELMKEIQPNAKTAHVLSLELELQQRLSTRVEIRVRDNEKGKVVISFDNNEQFERIMEALRQ